MKLTDFKVLTFECRGALIDREQGIEGIPDAVPVKPGDIGHFCQSWLNVQPALAKVG